MIFKAPVPLMLLLLFYSGTVVSCRLKGMSPRSVDDKNRSVLTAKSFLFDSLSTFWKSKLSRVKRKV